MFSKFFYSELQSQGVKSLGFYGAQRRTPAAHERDHVSKNCISKYCIQKLLLYLFTSVYN
jgi:hypothetical protein